MFVVLKMFIYKILFVHLYVSDFSSKVEHLNMSVHNQWKRLRKRYVRNWLQFFVVPFREKSQCGVFWRPVFQAPLRRLNTRRYRFQFDADVRRWVGVTDPLDLIPLSRFDRIFEHDFNSLSSLRVVPHLQLFLYYTRFLLRYNEFILLLRIFLWIEC